MHHPLLTVIAAPGARPLGGVGVQRIELPDDEAATLDLALRAALAPVALRLGPGESLRPGVAAIAAEAARHQPHRAWWWACDGPAERGRSPQREDLLSLLLAHDRPLPGTLFRPGSVLARGGFGRHPGPAFAFADACGRLRDGLPPGRVEGPLTEAGCSDESATLRLDRAGVAADFADRCLPRGRDAVWAACAETRAGLVGSRRPVVAPGAPLRAAA